MKKMVFVIGILAVVLVGALLYVGFHPGSGFAHGNGRFFGCLMEKFADELALSTEQKEQLMQIAEEVRGKHQEMRSLHAAAKKEVIGELRNQEIDREKIDLMYSNTKGRFDEMYDLLVSRFLEFHKTLTPEQREKLVAEMEKHHGRYRRFHPRWKDR